MRVWTVPGNGQGKAAGRPPPQKVWSLPASQNRAKGGRRSGSALTQTLKMTPQTTSFWEMTVTSGKGQWSSKSAPERWRPESDGVGKWACGTGRRRPGARERGKAWPFQTAPRGRRPHTGHHGRAAPGPVQGGEAGARRSASWGQAAGRGLGTRGLWAAGPGLRHAHRPPLTCSSSGVSSGAMSAWGAVSGSMPPPRTRRPGRTAQQPGAGSRMLRRAPPAGPERAGAGGPCVRSPPSAHSHCSPGTRRGRRCSDSGEEQEEMVSCQGLGGGLSGCRPATHAAALAPLLQRRAGSRKGHREATGRRAPVQTLGRPRGRPSPRRLHGETAPLIRCWAGGDRARPGRGRQRAAGAGDRGADGEPGGKRRGEAGRGRERMQC